MRVFLLTALVLVVFGIDNAKADDEWDYESPQAELLSGDAENWNLGDGWSAGPYVWDGSNDGSLTSNEFQVWNSQPFLVVEAEYDLTEAFVKAQVRTGSSGAWYDIKWRSNDRISTLYSIPGEQYDNYPEKWNGFSDRETFFADLGSVEQIGDADGNLQEQFIRGLMQVRLTGTNTGGGGSFTVFSLSIVGVDEHEVDVKSISPTTQNAEPSSLTELTRTYTVKTFNYGAASDSGVIDFVITAPDNSFIVLDDGTFAVIDSILQKGPVTYVAIKQPIFGAWENNSRNGPNGVDQTAYIGDDGLIEWPSGTTEQFSETGWKIDNPTKSFWNDEDGKPYRPDESNFASSGSISTVSIEVTIGFAKWAPPGTYMIQADVRSWLDYDNTFTSNDPNGQASLVIPKPELSIGNFAFTSHATGASQSGQGWVKNSCVKNEGPYFSFMAEVLNTGTETVGTFKVGLLDYESNSMNVDVGIYGTSNGWAIDEFKTTAEGAEILTDGNKKYVMFKATAEDLGMYDYWTGDGVSANYLFYLAVDTADEITESNENNNRVPIIITAVKSLTTTGGINGFIGYDISLMSGEMPKSRSSIEGNVTPTGSMMASEDGLGTWTIQMVKMNPQVSVSSVYWYLLDESGITIDHGLVSDIYGCFEGPGNAVIFVDNDFNGRLSPGDKFEVYPGRSSSVLESVSSVSDYRLRLRYIGNDTNDIALDPIIKPVTDEETEEENEEGNEEENEEEVLEEIKEDTLPSISIISAVTMLGLIAIFRRK